MKPLIWKGEPPQLIYCEPDKHSVLKIEELSGGNWWYSIRVGKDKTYDSFLGKTATTLDQAKSICEEIYKAFKEDRKPELLLHNKLP